MRKIAFWAHRHPWPARILLVILHLLLLIIAWKLGRQLRSADYLLPRFFQPLVAGLFLAAFFLYPKRNARPGIGARRHFLFRKSFDIALAASTFMIMLGIANHDDPFLLIPSLHSETRSLGPGDRKHPTASEILASLSTRDRHSLTRIEKRILRKEFRKQLGIYAVAKLTGKKKEAIDAGVVILSIVAALGLFVLVASLACELSCNGAEGAAWVLLIGGTAAIIVGLVLFLNSQKKRKAKKAAAST